MPIIEHGYFDAVRPAEQMGVIRGVCRTYCLAPELTHFKNHLTSRSSRSLTLTRTFGTPRLVAHGSAILAQKALRTKRRLPGR